MEVNNNETLSTGNKENALCFLEKGPVVFFKWKNEPGWPVEYVSENVEEVLGYSVKSFISGKTKYSEIIHKDDLLRVSDEVGSAGKANLGEFKHQAYRLYTLKGNVIYVDDYTKIIRNNKGGITHYLGYIYDITEKKTSENELLKIKAAIGATSDAIGISDADGVHFYQNETFDQMFGYTVEEIGKLEFAILYADKQIAVEVFNTILSGGVWNGELEMVHKSGTKFNVFLRANAVKNTQGEVVAVIGIHTDITKKKQAEKELQESESRLQELLNLLQAGVLVIEENTHKIIYANREALNMSKYEEHELIGKSCHHVICPAQNGKCPITDLKMVVDKSEKLLVCSDKKKKDILKTVKKTVFKNKPVLIETFVDITELKNTRKKLEKKVNELEQFNTVAIDRELAMINLKNEVNTLCVELGKKPPYDLEGLL